MKEIIDNKDLVKERLIESADNLFSSFGIKSITMDEIASSIGISKRTLYQIFSDKEDLLLACILYRQNAMKLYVEELLKQTDNVLEIIILCYKFTMKKIHNVSYKFFEDIKRYPKAYEIFCNGQKRDSKDHVAFFHKGVEQGLFRSDINFDILHILLKEQMNVLLNSQINQKYSMSLIYESIVFTFLRGVSTSKGNEILEKFIKDYKDEQNNLL